MRFIHTRNLAFSEVVAPGSDRSTSHCFHTTHAEMFALHLNVTPPAREHKSPALQRNRANFMGSVESKRSAVAYRTGGAECERRLSLPLSPRSPSLRFPSPLIEPDVTISVIRLSDGFHVRHAQKPDDRQGRTTPRPVPRTRAAPGTVRSQTRQPYAGGEESHGPCGRDGAPPRAAPSTPNRS